MLLWALVPSNPYEYYIVLRLVCCAAFAYLAVQAFHREKQAWVWVLGITAVVYNPIFRVHLTRGIWSVVNVATIGIAVWSAFALNAGSDGKKVTKDESNDDEKGGERCGRKS
jgi:hypothetical protein